MCGKINSSVLNKIEKHSKGQGLFPSLLYTQQVLQGIYSQQLSAFNLSIGEKVDERVEKRFLEV